MALSDAAIASLKGLGDQMINRTIDTTAPQAPEGSTADLKAATALRDRLRNLARFLGDASWGIEQGLHDLRVSVSVDKAVLADQRLKQAVDAGVIAIATVADRVAGEGTGSPIYPQPVLDLLNAAVVWDRECSANTLECDNELHAACRAYGQSLAEFGAETILPSPTAADQEANRVREIAKRAVDTGFDVVTDQPEYEPAADEDRGCAFD